MAMTPHFSLYAVAETRLAYSYVGYAEECTEMGSTALYLSRVASSFPPITSGAPSDGFRWGYETNMGRIDSHFSENLLSVRSLIRGTYSTLTISQ